jgi:hypothetical protein
MVIININKPVGDRDHEVLGMGSFWGIYTTIREVPVTRDKH